MSDESRASAEVNGAEPFTEARGSAAPCPHIWSFHQGDDEYCDRCGQREALCPNVAPCGGEKKGNEHE